MMEAQRRSGATEQRYKGKKIPSWEGSGVGFLIAYKASISFHTSLLTGIPDFKFSLRIFTTFSPG